MLRTVVGVLAGYAIFAVSAIALFQVSGHGSHEAASRTFMIGSTLYGMSFAFLGGYAASAIAGRQDTRAAFCVAVIIALFAVAPLTTMRAESMQWSAMVSLLFMAPIAWVGGVMQLRQARTRRSMRGV